MVNYLFMLFIQNSVPTLELLNDFNKLFQSEKPLPFLQPEVEKLLKA